jgi:hydrogenase maturation protease
MNFVLGIGNRLLGDDGAGPAVIAQLMSRATATSSAIFKDGGTIGLALLPEIEDAAGFIAIDAAELNAPPGTATVAVSLARLEIWANDLPCLRR